MSCRDYIHFLDSQKKLLHIKKPVSTNLQAAGILKAMEPQPILFEDVSDYPYRIAGNLLCTKESFSNAFNISLNQIIPFLINAIESPSRYQVVNEAPCQEVVINDPDLYNIPILKHCENDGGNYISSGVVITKHPQYGQNMDFHRCMQFSKNEMALRIVKRRNFDTYLQDSKQLDVAVCVGNAPNVLVAAATSVDIGIDELEIANTLEPLKVVKTKNNDLLIPADTEFVLEGTIYLDHLHEEGPFVDLTETQDIIRNEPVLVVKTITHRHDAIWQALLPGGLEHKILMGMPREPTIYQRVSKEVECLDINISPGGCSWLHAIVKIRKTHNDDGLRAIKAAFAGHSSCKHVFIVDDDIDIYNPQQVEWAMATRFQGDRDMYVLDKETGSSLDPSAEPVTNLTTKIGFDLTKPLASKGKSFERVTFPDLNIKDFLE